MAKNAGKIFEDNIKASVPSDVYYYRLRDSASSFGGGNDSLRFSVSNDYDCLMFKMPNFFGLELKSTKGTSMSIQKEKTDKSKMIKLSQIKGLNKINVDGGYGAFLLNFRGTGNTYFLDVKDFNKFNDNTDKKSINENDVLKHNGILLESRKLKVNYRYNITKMIEDVVNN